MADLNGLARALHLSSESLRMLFAGRADIEVARAVGVSTETLQRFLDGRADVDMARRLGVASTDLRSLTAGIGREATAAFVLGLAFGTR